eukprot:CAMPEP_0202953510 /NCGR_PEP_ID=MMETSP1395-20130829/46618_1 /ASSEMBLY_ACC=CAM_ASM_000871 /TAXON_ID=5961 /ORGANISM="Blepharisma japonicum, Strain Stock R1072" /LENGTH=32 /DNA_ID= /DNA_START= /DNA_END= /DNA_ORIENTATION=
MTEDFGRANLLLENEVLQKQAQVVLDLTLDLE